MNLQIVNPIEWVRRNQSLFFPAGQIDVIRLTAYVMSDVLELGGGECRIVKRDRWWFVVSDADWLAQAAVPVHELFESVIPAPAHGEHSMRAEVLLSAYAADIFTQSDEGALQIKGCAPEPRLIEGALHAGWSRRVIAFRLA
jgi:hypothetical protein